MAVAFAPTTSSMFAEFCNIKCFPWLEKKSFIYFLGAGFTTYCAIRAILDYEKTDFLQYRANLDFQDIPGPILTCMYGVAPSMTYF